eukprot:Gregarina_sp_Pseudo_9__863@NODE_1553_length_1500_cov_21_995209_g1440_i0_p1_GENE_NODE_1553_length_1500_cov_21_995209_g1440_i0NODE_1553_length_1500_cov_21_995209_g1440_i0_p1_ORF_typecomplete_len474_score46_23Lyase_1/PF00206_20/1e47ASL_C/PF08328_11/5_2e03ASL_C/PF08328_11/3e33DUF2303/PF10065_9/0_3_NODE_1553_length_1500_cov_21_995209_g1440_i0431422
MSAFLSPLDGRYATKLQEIKDRGFTERKLIEYKLRIECDWLLWLVQAGVTTTKVDIDSLRECLHLVPSSFIDAAVEHEQKVNHDTKAVELAVRDALAATPFASLMEFVHFGLTSEDVTNLAYALMFMSVWEQVAVPHALKLIGVLEDLSRQFALSPMLGMTHGQPASATTFGKEEAVFLFRLKNQQLCASKNFHVKFGGGATGTFSALTTSFPFIDWVEQCSKFVTSLHPKFKLDPLTTQIANRESLAEFLHLLMRYNNILTDLCVDHWLYCSRNLLRLKVVKEEVGSSTMPHKINPIHFENAEGNLEVANNTLGFLANKLTQSRMQRDLSDSTVIRNIGVALGHTILAWKSVLTGLSRIQFDQETSTRELLDHWEILAEPVQTILRKYPTISDPYSVLKDFTRTGEKMKQATFLEFIERVCRPLISEEDYGKLMKLSPDTYIGIAPELAVQAINLSLY